MIGRAGVWQMVRLLAVLLPFVGGVTGLATQGDIDGGTISGTSSVPVRPISVSGDAALVPLAQRVLGLHGGLRLVAGGEASANVVVTPGAGGGVRLAIETGRPARTVMQNEFAGPDTMQALAQAVDAAVQQLLGVPGFATARLAFVARRGAAPQPEVYVGDVLFQRITQVSGTRCEVVSPALSPDGRQVAFTSYYRGFPEIVGFDLATRQARSIAAYKGNNTGATFSPTGDRLALVLSPGGNAELFVGSAAGTGLTRLTTSRGLESDPAWSPDGTELVFASDSMGRPQLFLINASGGAVRRLPTNISGYCAEPDWNPRNRDQIVFTIASGNQFKLALWSFQANSSTALPMAGAFDAVHPAWLPDGRHVVYTERTARMRRLAVYDTVSRRRTGYLHSESWGHCWQASPTR